MPGKKGLNKAPKIPPFEFNIKKILEERKRFTKLSKERAQILEEMKAFDNMMKLDMKNTFVKDDNIINNNDNNNGSPLVSPKSDFVFDNSKNTNIPFNENLYTDAAELCSQRLLIMSIEQNELQAKIHFHHLMNAKWSPELNNVRSTLQKWNIDLDYVICKPLQKLKINFLELNFGQHNFEFVMNFIIHSILRNNKFSNDDLLTLAEFAVAMYFDHNCRLLRKLFHICIETALHESNETDIITYAQELYSKYEAHLVKMTGIFFFPREGQIMRKIYAYLTFKLYKSLTGNVDCIIEIPSNNDWYIQDVVDRDYFSRNPSKVLKSIIKLLEHVVITFDLYSDEKKMSEMHDFLRSVTKPSVSAMPTYPKLFTILDHWRLHLFRLHIERIKNAEL